MTVNRLHQVPATSPRRDASSHSTGSLKVGFSRVSQAARQTAHRLCRRFPIHSVCISILAPSEETARGCGSGGLRSKTSLVHRRERARDVLATAWLVEVECRTEKLATGGRRVVSVCTHRSSTRTHSV